MLTKPLILRVVQIHCLLEGHLLDSQSGPVHVHFFLLSDGDVLDLTGAVRLVQSAGELLEQLARTVAGVLARLGTGLVHVQSGPVHVHSLLLPDGGALDLAGDVRLTVQELLQDFFHWSVLA